MPTQGEQLATLTQWTKGHDKEHIHLDREFKGINGKLDTIIANGNNHSNGTRRQQYLNKGTALGSAGGLLGGSGVLAAVLILLERLGVL